MAAGFTVLILVCSASLAVPDCSVQNAIDVVRGPESNSAYGCGLASQAMIASTALGPELGKDQYVKIVCTDRHISSIRDLVPSIPKRPHASIGG
jgi:hypothetical protein